MASDLLTIARSGALAARQALDIAGQNIANASTPGYVRRSAALSEVAAGSVTTRGSLLSGVRVDGVIRDADAFRQSEARRTGADTARAGAQLSAYQDVEGAIETAGVHGAIGDLESSLTTLAGDPTNAALRADTLQKADTTAQSFNGASHALAAVSQGLATDAASSVARVNAIAADLARANQALTRAGSASGQPALLDRRDLLLRQLSDLTDVTTTFAPDQTVTVQVGGASGPALVSGGSAVALNLATAADGTISFDVGGAAAALSGGALTGIQQGLVKLRDTRNALDGVASSLIATANAAQASGADLNGAGGQPLFAGAGAATIALALTSGAQLATAPGGSPAGSRDPGNVATLNQALKANDPASAMDALLLSASSATASAGTAHDTLTTLSDAAAASLDAQSGVNLDQEAVDLVRYQQAFQASGKVMQVATDLFDTLLRIG